MIFDPMEVTTHLRQEYSEWFSAKEAHHIQVGFYGVLNLYMGTER